MRRLESLRRRLRALTVWERTAEHLHDVLSGDKESMSPSRPVRTGAEMFWVAEPDAWVWSEPVGTLVRDR